MHPIISQQAYSFMHNHFGKPYPPCLALTALVRPAAVTCTTARASQLVFLPLVSLHHSSLTPLPESSIEDTSQSPFLFYGLQRLLFVPG